MPPPSGGERWRIFTRRVVVVGTGYVGLTTGACLASLGHRVVCADVDRAKVERLRAGEIGIREDGLAELVARGWPRAGCRSSSARRPRWPSSPREGDPVEVVFLCVPTPMGVGGVADLTRRRGRGRGDPAPRCRRARWWSTSRRCPSAPPSAPPSCSAATTSPSSATRSSCARARAVHDFLHPDRIVVGVEQPGRRRARRRALRPARRADRAHRRGQRRDDQVRGQLLPGDEAVLRQRARRAVRAARRRHRRRHRGHRLRPADRPVLPVARARAGAAPACPRTPHALLQVADSRRLRVPAAARHDRHQHPPAASGSSTRSGPRSPASAPARWPAPGSACSG